MQTNFEKEKLAYQSPWVGIYCIGDDVVRTSDDPAVDDGYGNSSNDGNFDWGVM